MGLHTAFLKRDGGWWIDWVEKVPGVDAQERTRKELLKPSRDFGRGARFDRFVANAWDVRGGPADNLIAKGDACALKFVAIEALKCYLPAENLGPANEHLLARPVKFSLFVNEELIC
jgi:hypothetical protein